MLLRYRTAFGIASAGACFSRISRSSLDTETTSHPSIPGSSTRPSYSVKEVERCDGSDGKPMWVTFEGKVYDVTNFKAEHPGGNLIAQAAGGDVSQFWKFWAYHFHSKKVQGYLDALYIGELSDCEAQSNSTKEVADTERVPTPYATDPSRNLALHKVLTSEPFCSETLPAVLNRSYLTSAEALYVRNHAPVPTEVGSQVEECELSFSSSPHHHHYHQDAKGGSISKSISLKDLLQRYPKVSVVSVIQCAGNRAGDDGRASGPNAFADSPYENIDAGLMGNVCWSGIRLADVLLDLFPEECAAATAIADVANASNDAQQQRHDYERTTTENAEWHVIFAGADGYETSTPLSEVLRPHRDCLLATGMNGEPLTPDHGFPVRVLLPGIAGARNVKWLESVTLSRTPSTSPWNAYYYRKSDGSHIQELPLQSVILASKVFCAPSSPPVPSTSSTSPSTSRGSAVAGVSGSGGGIVGNVRQKWIQVEGVAYSGAASTKIAKVQLSTDGGGTWQDANLLLDEVQEDDARGFHSWVRFLGRVPVPIPLSPLITPSATAPAGAVGGGGGKGVVAPSSIPLVVTTTAAQSVAGNAQISSVFTAADPRMGQGSKLVKVRVRAIDSEGVTQPRVSPQHRGYLYNGWHSVDVWIHPGKKQSSPR